DKRSYLAEVEPRHDAHREFERALHPFDDPHQLAPRVRTASLAHGEEIDEPRLARPGGEGRAQDEALREVFAADAESRARRHLVVPAPLPVEQPTEARSEE